MLLMQVMFHCSILRVHTSNLIVGAYGDEDPPVPIPNTEVKLISVENTWRVTARENRAVPTQRKATHFELLFFVCVDGYLKIALDAFYLYNEIKGEWKNENKNHKYSSDLFYGNKSGRLF